MPLLTRGTGILLWPHVMTTVMTIASMVLWWMVTMQTRSAPHGLACSRCCARCRSALGSPPQWPSVLAGALLFFICGRSIGFHPVVSARGLELFLACCVSGNVDVDSCTMASQSCPPYQRHSCNKNSCQWRPPLLQQQRPSSSCAQQHSVDAYDKMQKMENLVGENPI